MAFFSRNPATGEELAVFEEHTPEELEARLAKAAATYEVWKQTSFKDRAALMRRLAQVFRELAPDYGKLATLEMGKPLKAAIAEVEKCATACEYYADNASDQLAEEVIKTDASESFVRFDPIGIVFAVMPWNFPFWQVVRFAAPALMAGNVGVLKHASNVPQCAMALERAFLAAGFPEGAFTNLLIGSSRVEGVVMDDRVKAVTLTGSEPAGMAVASAAGRAIKKTVLELGGSDPFLVLDDADVAQAAKVAVTARLQNAGQSCIAAKRFIVMRSVADQFIAEMSAGFEAMVVGDGMDPSTTLGPLATAQICSDIEDQVQRAVKEGATVITGGTRVGEKGNFYAPTILQVTDRANTVFREETFGPVAAVLVVDSEEEAILAANDTSFGLGSVVWTRDHARAKRMAPRMDAGCVFVNGMVKSDARLPFGGIKRSGYGRELAAFGIREFVNTKTVWIA